MSEICEEELPDLGYTARTQDFTIDKPEVTMSCAKPCDPANSVGNSTNIGNSDKKLSHIIKMVPALNFKCGHCLKKYTTDDGIQKHLKKDHGIVAEFPVNDYTTFMGTRRKKVVVNSKPKSHNTVSDPPIRIDSLETEEPLRCSMCDKVFMSCEGVRKHLKTFHNVSHNVTSLYKKEFSQAVAPKRSQPVFTPPLIAATSRIQVSGPPSKSGQTQNHCSSKTSPMPAVPKAAKSVVEETPAKKEPIKPKPKPKPKFKFCNSISNPFSNGDVKFEKISIWSKSKSNSKHSKPKQQQVTAPKLTPMLNQSPLSTTEPLVLGQSPLSTAHLVPDQSPLSSETIAPAQSPLSTTEPLVPAQSSLSTTEPLVPVPSPLATEPLVLAQSPLSTEPLVPAQSPLSTEPLVPAQSPLSTEPLVPAQSPLSTEPIEPTQSPLSMEPKVLTQPPVSKRRRTCHDPSCKACSILVNCGECNNCINKSLK